ncbi:MAG: acyl-ACP thioesterase [Bacteroidaceae bacterium]|nr:acyl-ACP thioesterase [Bacteroidaceae bacterium]
METKFGHYDFVVEPFEEDITGTLSWGTLGNLILRSASLHAGQHGFGFSDVNTRSHAWVLSRLVIEMKTMPKVFDQYAVETWVSRVYRQFTDRHFDVLSETGERIGQATSIWALIDMNSRTPADLSAMADDKFAQVMLPEREIEISGPSRIKLSKDAALIYSHKAAYSDLDINGHVNSIRYIELLLDTFSLDQFKSNPPKRIDVAYCLESYCGEQLDIYSETINETQCAFEIRRDQNVIVKAIISC